MGYIFIATYNDAYLQTIYLRVDGENLCHICEWLLAALSNHVLIQESPQQQM